ncbi:2520_t:CDS:2, partial [Dentiscutata heterogama]
GEYTCEELRTVIQELNKDQDGKVIIKSDQVYWHRRFPEFKKNYLHDYPKCHKLSRYRQELLQQSQLAKRKPNKRLKRRIEQFINDSNQDDVNISNSRIMLDDNYFVQKPVEVIEITN